MNPLFPQKLRRTVRNTESEVGWLSQIEDLYLRCWDGKTVWVLSLRDGLKKKVKRRKCFKLLIGIAG